jgi:hypothetical protein
MGKIRTLLSSTEFKSCLYIFQSIVAALDVIIVCYFLSAAEIAYVIEYSRYYYECNQAKAIICGIIITICVRLLIGLYTAYIMVKNIINWLDANKGIFPYYIFRGVVSFLTITVFAAFSGDSCIGELNSSYHSLYVIFIIEAILQISYVLCMLFYLFKW